MPRPHDPAYNRDDEHKPGSPQRMAQEPAGSEGSERTRKTQTDPVTGEPNRGKPAPAASETDQDV